MENKIYFKDYYRILGVSPRASYKEIERAFRRLSKRYHPDILQQSGYSETEIKRYLEMYKEMSEAYNILKNPSKREQYDILYYKSHSESTGMDRTNDNIIHVDIDFDIIKAYESLFPEHRIKYGAKYGPRDENTKWSEDVDFAEIAELDPTIHLKPRAIKRYKLRSKSERIKRPLKIGQGHQMVSQLKGVTSRHKNKRLATKSDGKGVTSRVATYDHNIPSSPMLNTEDFTATRGHGYRIKDIPDRSYHPDKTWYSGKGGQGGHNAPNYLVAKILIGLVTVISSIVFFYLIFAIFSTPPTVKYANNVILSVIGMYIAFVVVMVFVFYIYGRMFSR